MYFGIYVALSSSDDEDFEDAVEEHTERFTVIMPQGVAHKKGHM